MILHSVILGQGSVVVYVNPINVDFPTAVFVSG